LNNGEKYIGEWKDGEKSGKGIYYFENGDIYDGNLELLIKSLLFPFV